jgi:hypothetical protein
LGLDRGIEETLKNLDKLVVSPEILAHWCNTVETTAKNKCKDEVDKIKLSYCPDKRSIEFYVKDAKSRDCLLKTIEIHLSSMPGSLQAFFSVFKYNLKNMRFNE